MLQISRWALWIFTFLLFVCNVSRSYRSDGISVLLENNLHKTGSPEETTTKETTSTVIGKHLNQHRKIRSIINNTSVNNTGSDSVVQDNTTRKISTTVSEVSATLPTLITVKGTLQQVTIPPRTIIPRTEQMPRANCENQEYSCSSKCRENTTYDRFSSFIRTAGRDCYCDKACDDIFQDCCADYEQSCSVNSKLKSNDDFYKRERNWRCIRMQISSRSCTVQKGFWVVARCPNSWPNNEVKRKCHNAATELDADSLDLYLPVSGLPDLLTYRNKYCALCNNVSTYEFWSLIFKSDAIPPPHYTPNDFNKFIAENYHFLSGIRPKENQLIRWCTYEHVISICPNTTSEESLKDCVQGMAGLVNIAGSHTTTFKNKACALCNGHKFVCGVSKREPTPCNIDGSAITRAISLRDYGVSIMTKSCRKNEVFDTFLGKCRQSYVINELNLGSADEYQVTMSILLKSRIIMPPDKVQLNKALTNYFQVENSQLSDVNINRLAGDSPEMFLVFKIQLTHAQSLILASDAKLNGSSNETTSLRRLFKFHQAFQLRIGLESLTIFRQEIRQVNCTRPHTYLYGEYVFLEDLRIRVLSNDATYEQFEYYVNSSMKNASVTVCMKIVSTACNGSYIKLNTTEYYFTQNLTLLHNSLAYKLGDYIYNNNSAYICVHFDKQYKIITNETKDHLALVILTWLGFILSIIGLLVLFITYIIFKELRTLPGKNLMNLCISLSLAELFWIVGSTLDNYPTTCTVVAIGNHYFFLVFFTASSVIAFHSCLVFGRKMAIRRSLSEDNKIFIIYFLVIWALPGLFLLIVGLLDHYEVFIIDYGKSVVCWLGTKESKIFLFILPFGLSLIFNLLLFIVVALRLRENKKSSLRALGKEAKKRESQNVMVCLKLSTLMGFSWLFGLLQVAVETETDAFAYLFIIFVSFQGLFICAAFLFQRKIYDLYKNFIFKSSSTRSSGTRTGADTPSNTRKTNVSDTKL